MPCNWVCDTVNNIAGGVLLWVCFGRHGRGLHFSAFIGTLVT